MSDSECRILVRNLSTLVGAADLRTLFQKLNVSVEDVYIPPPTVTGLRRNFAIVVAACSKEAAAKSVKAFNGSIWKGSRINMEFAKQPYFINRLQAEKENERKQEQREMIIQGDNLSSSADVTELTAAATEEEAVAAVVVSAAAAATAEEHIVPYSGRPMNFRKRKLVAPVIKSKGAAKSKSSGGAFGAAAVLTKVRFSVSTDPQLRVNICDTGSGDADAASLTVAATTAAAAARKKRKGVFLDCGIKTIFDPALISTATAATTAAAAATPNAVEHQNQLQLQYDNECDSDDLKDAEDDSVVLKTLSDEPQQQQQTATATSAAVEVSKLKLKSAVDQQAGGGVRRGFGTLLQPQKLPHKAAAAVATAAAVDCCIEDEEDEIAISKRLKAQLLDDDPDVEEPCVAAAELEEESLRRERLRALSLLETILSTTDATTAATNTTTSAATAGTTATATATAVKVTAAAADEDSEIAGIELNESLQSFDTTAATTAATTTAATTTAATTAAAAANSGDLLVSSSSESSSLQQQQQQLLVRKDGFADMGQLKGIFQREFLQSADYGAAAATDAISLAAEKQGVDIHRSIINNTSTAATVAAVSANAGFNTSSNSNNNIKSSSSNNITTGTTTNTGTTAAAVFGFNFLGGDSDTIATDVATTTTTTTDVAVAVATDARSGAVFDFMSNEPAATTTTAAAAKRNNKRNNNSNPSGVTPAVVLKIQFDAADLVTVAKQFSRDRSLAELTDGWRKGRERLVLDYKRKRKDMRRRQQQQQQQHGGAMHSSSSSSQQQQRRFTTAEKGTGRWQR